MKASIAASLFLFPLSRLVGQPVGLYLAEYRARDSWSPEQLEEYQRRALFEVTTHALGRCEFYRRRYSGRTEIDRSGMPASVLLQDFPVLARDDLLSEEAAIRAALWQERVVRKTSGGSTGRPVTIFKSADALARERVATLRAYAWAGLAVGAPQARLWGVPITRKARLSAKGVDLVGNRLRLSAFGVSDEKLARYMERMRRFRPHYVYGYVSLIVELCRFLEGTGRQLPDSVKCIITTSEVLDLATRSYIESTSQRRVFNEYGCGEVGSIAHECEEGELHVMADNLILEAEPAEGLPPGLGQLYVTDLHNYAMPLIRYRLGDLGLLSDKHCACGRPYPILEKVVGRAYDLIIGSNGKLYHPEAVLYAFEELKREGVNLPPYQVIQMAAGQIEVRFADSKPIDSAARGRLTLLLRATLGRETKITYELVAALERESSGKLRVVKRAPSLERASVR